MNHEFNIGYSDPVTVATLRRDLFLRDISRATEVKSAPQGSFASQITDSLLLLLGGQF